MSWHCPYRIQSLAPVVVPPRPLLWRAVPGKAMCDQETWGTPTRCWPNMFRFWISINGYGSRSMGYGHYDGKLRGIITWYYIYIYIRRPRQTQGGARQGIILLTLVSDYYRSRRSSSRRSKAKTSKFSCTSSRSSGGSSSSSSISRR